MRRGTIIVPQMNHFAFTAAIVLLFNVWGMNRPSGTGGGGSGGSGVSGGGGGAGGMGGGGMMGTGVRVDWEKEIQDVHICMRFIKRSLGRYVDWFLVALA